MNRQILIIDDDPGVLESCRTILEDLGHEVETAPHGDAGLAHLRSRPFDLALVDLKMPGMSGLEVLEQAAEIDPDLIIIIFTAYGTIDSAVDAVKKGAFNYLTKPYTAAQLATAVEKALEHSRLVRDNRRLQAELKECCLNHQIIGRSRELEQVLATVAKAAPSDANVLVMGESGTGKELVARALHANSKRAEGPFIPVDCAAIPPHLLESELFGHEKGAFTGADRVKRGLLEHADGGTLFLDEIGELSPELQAKLLRTLQERNFRRLGGEQVIQVNIRIVCSTNRDLPAEALEGRFRQDLLYRLNVVTLLLPPLRERQGDIAILVRHFADDFARATDKPCGRVTVEAMRALEGYSWPGNVRELRNVLERAVVLCEGGSIRVGDLPDYLRRQTERKRQRSSPLGYKAARDQWMESKSKSYLTSLLRQHKGNISAVAREAQISRKSVYELMRRYGIDPTTSQTRSKKAASQPVTQE